MFLKPFQEAHGGTIEMSGDEWRLVIDEIYVIRLTVAPGEDGLWRITSGTISGRYPLPAESEHFSP